MGDTFDKEFKTLFQEYESLIANPEFQRAINVKLSNEGEEISEDDWLEGSLRFADENPDIFRFRGK